MEPLQAATKEDRCFCACGCLFW